jgi:hypothetical protein
MGHIKDATTRAQLVRIAIMAKTCASNNLARNKGQLHNSKGDYLPLGLDFTRFARVMNLATKKMAWILKCQPSEVPPPFKMYEIKVQPPKETVPAKDIDALDAPKTGFFKIDQQLSTEDVVDPSFHETTKDWVYEGKPNLVYHMSQEEIETFSPQFSRGTDIQSFSTPTEEIIAWLRS